MPSPLLAASNALGAAGTAEVVDATLPLVQWCWIKASPDNTGYIYIGPSTVDDTTDRYALVPGEEKYLEYDEGLELSKLYFDGDTTGNRVDILYPGAI